MTEDDHLLQPHTTIKDLTGKNLFSTEDEGMTDFQLLTEYRKYFKPHKSVERFSQHLEISNHMWN